MYIYCKKATQKRLSTRRYVKAFKQEFKVGDRRHCQIVTFGT
ncbi:MAG: hypothetical protein ACFKPT_01185 [Gloeotrichia echinulata GP01]